MNKKCLPIFIAFFTALALFVFPSAALAGPDLSVENLNVTPSTIFTTDNVTVTFDFYNIGDEAVGRAYVHFYVDNTEHYLLYYGNRDFQPGENDSIQLFINLQLTVGVHTVYVVADAENILTEDDESNNSAIFEVTVESSVNPSAPESPQTIVNINLPEHDLQQGWSRQIITLYHNDNPSVGHGVAEDQTFPNEYNHPIGNYFFSHFPVGNYHIRHNITCSNGELLWYFVNQTLGIGSNTENIHIADDCSGPWMDYYVPPTTTTTTATATTTTTTTALPTTTVPPTTTTTAAGCGICVLFAVLALAFFTLKRKSGEK